MSDRSRLPDFLIIGAMKSGTTTLYRDLYEHPDIYFPEEKEPEDLKDDKVLTPKGRQVYEGLFARAKPGQVKGEASAAYTKRPEVEGAAERAFSLVGPDLKIIYVVRDPVARMVSHYKHEWVQGDLDLEPNEALLKVPRFVDYSRYAYQLQPWRERFGDRQIFLLRFEDYVRDRAGSVEGLCNFLGVSAAALNVDLDSSFNVTDGKRVARYGWIRRLQKSHLWGRILRPLFPWGLRSAIRNRLLPRGRPLPPMDIRPEVRAELLSRLSEQDLKIASGVL